MITATHRTKSRLLDEFGGPLVARKQAAQLGTLVPQVPVRATYDAAQTSDDFKNYWAAADSYDADSANTAAVRHTLIKRSRYEIGNNGYSDGIAQTQATDLVGVGPSLRMETGSEGFNRLVEIEFSRWMKATKFRRKLWCMAHAKYSDGEAIAVLRQNRRLKHPVAMDLCLYEAEQCQTPQLPFNEPGRIDGIWFDEFGNPTFYDILPRHPGSTAGIERDLTPERVPADYVLHWFKLRRPGQHRGIPEAASTLNTGAASRRWREATLAAAETAADFSVFLKTAFEPDEVDQVSPMSTLDIQKRMMTALPLGWSAEQMRAEHPNTTYAEFMRSHISEQARPKSMPYNKAACDSSSYNYASGRLDHQTYFAGLDVDREDANDLVLDQCFDVWWPIAVRRFRWLGGNPEAIGPAASAHTWDWPTHQVADLKAEADSVDKRLRNGSLALTRYYSDQGKDFNDELAVMAKDFGLSEDEMRTILLTALFNSQNQQSAMQTANNQTEGQSDGEDETEDEG